MFNNESSSQYTPNLVVLTHSYYCNVSSLSLNVSHQFHFLWIPGIPMYSGANVWINELTFLFLPLTNFSATLHRTTKFSKKDQIWELDQTLWTVSKLTVLHHSIHSPLSSLVFLWLSKLRSSLSLTFRELSLLHFLFLISVAESNSYPLHNNTVPILCVLNYLFFLCSVLCN